MTGAICAALLLLFLLLPAAAAQVPVDAADTIDAAGDGNGTSTRGGAAARGDGGGASRNKLVSSIDCQICEATCRVKCLINNLFQWGVCYQRCKADNCNDWCR
ncbi:hypothetical protein PR202_gb19914 [Eleusine coracana subsp. coracana]|uniref:Uncharacterized protein n=1 Tax=Eleusine coracana subsp. coracana TaxID=191504 RepID=A0AAV5F967_ELECO|nr:hypothetical protein QOZ80_3BG0279530 [Eleusine coracana subsp. coracana]GJN31506.1 hypothetical protein PR202_gb19914 [Eleusine coracana subsp. coracana]